MGIAPFLKLNENLDGLSHSAEIISNSNGLKTDAEIDSWILSQYKGGIRRLKIYNDISNYKFGEKGNFNIWFFANNANEATGIAINHWTGNQFSLRLETENGPTKIKKMSSPENSETVTILEQGKYLKNTEYTPVNDPRGLNFFSGYIHWSSAPVTQRQWHDNDNWFARLTAIELSSSTYKIRTAKMLINNSTGKIMFTEMMSAVMDSFGCMFSEEDAFDGIYISGKKN